MNSLFFSLALSSLTLISPFAISLEAQQPPLQLPDILQALNDKPELNTTDPLIHSQFIRTGPTIQVAILLDTSNSMDGLISQAKEQIWKIINELASANKQNKEVTLQVALYEYGKSSLAQKDGFLQMLAPLTNDLDLLSEQLFNLETQGGNEYAGQVILESIKQLNWSTHKDDLKLVLIAGNESFEQGSIDSAFALEKANQASIIVNTMFCGSYQEGLRIGWKTAAMLGKGKYLNINMNDDVTHIQTPFDDQINKYGEQLNNTYIGYGKNGKQAKTRQTNQDSNAKSSSSSVMTERNLAKASKQYKTDSWDIVSLYSKDKDKAIAMAKNNSEQFSGFNEEEIVKQLETQTKEREGIKTNINELKQKRAAFIKNKITDEAGDDFASVLLKHIKQQAIDNGYHFD